MQNPFHNAQWIWYGTPNVHVVNAYMQARRVFSLARVPKRAELCVTADARYALYVNGRFVNRGPARGYQKSWPFDRVDVAPYLRQGRNVLAALVHSYGVHTFQYLHQGWAGFLLSGAIGKVALSTGADWLVRQAPGYRGVLTRLTAQQGFQEFFDARLDDGAWVAVGYRGADWRKPICFPSGQEPWPAFEERGIPLLQEEITLPRAVISRAVGQSRADSAHADNVVKLFCMEKRVWQPEPNVSFSEGDSNGEALRPLNAAAVSAWSVPPAPGAQFRSYCLDFGREVVGCVRLAAAHARGGEIIDLIASETVTGGVPKVLEPDTTGDRIAVGGRVILKAGANAHELFAPWGLRYLVVTVRSAPRRFTLKLALKQIGYPIPALNFFECSDERLNRIFEVCLQTQRCCMLDAYVDCPFREQTQWGDASIQAMSGFPLTGSADLFRRYLRQIGMQTNPDGLVYALAPSDGYNHVLPDYACVWVMSFRDYYRQTGDLALFREMEPVIRTNLDFYGRWRTPLALMYPPRERWFWFNMGNAPAFERKGERGYSTSFNMLYLGALQAAARLYRRAGLPSAAQRYAGQADRLRAAIVRRLFDASQRRFHGGLTESGQPVPQTLGWGAGPVNGDPWSAGWAILLDVLPQHHAALADQIVALLKTPPLGRQGPTIWNLYFIFEALKKAGRFQAVIDCIRSWWWEGVIRQGLTTTPEGWGRCNDGGNSNCHAWGAHPILHCFNIVLGIWPADLAWRKIRLAPQVRDIAWARGRVLTPRGIVECEWKKQGARMAVKYKAPKSIQIINPAGPSPSARRT